MKCVGTGRSAAVFCAGFYCPLHVVYQHEVQIHSGWNQYIETDLYGHVNKIRLIFLRLQLPTDENGVEHCPLI